MTLIEQQLIYLIQLEVPIKEKQTNIDRGKQYLTIIEITFSQYNIDCLTSENQYTKSITNQRLCN